MAKIERALEVGDIVRIKSGGAPMTVLQVASPQTVKVIWFDAQLSLRTAEVTINALTRSRK
jgi:uncharacterized protein YodC (DUF2158 family)